MNRFASLPNQSRGSAVISTNQVPHQLHIGLTETACGVGRASATALWRPREVRSHSL